MGGDCPLIDEPTRVRWELELDNWALWTRTSRPGLQRPALDEPVGGYTPDELRAQHTERVLVELKKRRWALWKILWGRHVLRRGDVEGAMAETHGNVQLYQERLGRAYEACEIFERHMLKED